MIRKITKTIALTGLLCATSFGASDVMPADIKVIGSPGVRGAVLALIPQFERETGHKVSTEFVVIAVIKRKIEAGDAFDIAAVERIGPGLRCRGDVLLRASEGKSRNSKQDRKNQNKLRSRH